MYICPKDPTNKTFRSYWERYEVINENGVVADSSDSGEEYDTGVFCEECEEGIEAEEV